MAEEREGEEERFPALTFAQARDLILRPPLPERRPLPKGFYLTRRKGRELEGRCPCKIEWKRDEDPPPPLRRSYEIERVDNDEWRELKQLFDLRGVLTTVEEMIEVDVEGWVDELGEKLTKKVDNMKGEVMKAIDEGLSAKFRSSVTPPKSEGKGEGEDFEKRLKEHIERAVKDALMPEATKTTEVSFAGIARYVPFNPLMAMCYGWARAELDYKDSEEQFLTDCVVELFRKVYNKQLSLTDVE